MVSLGAINFYETASGDTTNNQRLHLGENGSPVRVLHIVSYIRRKGLMKKIIIIISLSVLTAIILGFVFFANEFLSQESVNVADAYLDEDMASPGQRDRILSARRFVAYSEFEATAPIELQKIIQSDERLYDAVAFAYLDVDAAFPSLRERIYEARYIIISSTDWFDDQISMGVVVRDQETGDVEEKIPAFSELFPNWSNPVEYARNESS